MENNTNITPVLTEKQQYICKLFYSTINGLGIFKNVFVTTIDGAPSLAIEPLYIFEDMVENIETNDDGTFYYIQIIPDDSTITDKGENAVVIAMIRDLVDLYVRGNRKIYNPDNSKQKQNTKAVKQLPSVSKKTSSSKKSGKSTKKGTKK